MPQHLKVKQLYAICVELLHNRLMKFCKKLDRSSVCAKYDILMSTKRYLAEKLPKCVLNEILEYNAKCDSSTDSALVQYYFFQIVTHDQLIKFTGKYIELSVSYWRCLFEESFFNLKVLNLALCCNDLILEMIPQHCPQLEYLNATSKYLFRDASSMYRSGNFNTNNRLFQLPVSDAGLYHLQTCKRLRILIINEPRGEHPIATNQITYNGLRHLLRHVPTLEDISYSDIGYVITTNFPNVTSLNLTTVRHIHPTASTMREIFRICRRLTLLHLNGSNTQTTEAAEELMQELCTANHRFTEIEFQNISFGGHFERFFTEFGGNLVSVSLSFTQAELSFQHIVTISLHCPNLRYFLCNNLGRDEQPVAPIESNALHSQPFSKLRSLHLSGSCIDIETILRFCTKHANDLEILKIHELKHIRNIQNATLKCINAPELRLLEFSRLVCTRQCIESIIEQFPCMNFLIVQCRENCADLVERIKSQNYDLVFIIQPIESNMYF